MSTIYYDANAGMERIFRANTIISDHPDYDVYFDLIDPMTLREKRRLRIVDKSTGADLLIADLNSKGGVKPLKDARVMYMPHIRPIYRYSKSCTPELERVFYAETDLTDTPGVDIKFCIELDSTTNKDIVRYLAISASDPAVPAPLQQIDIELIDGKKPLEGGIEFLKKNLKDSTIKAEQN